MGGIPSYIVCVVGVNDGLNMENVRENEEEGGIYEGYNGMYGEEYNELEIARGEAMVENEIEIDGK